MKALRCPVWLFGTQLVCSDCPSASAQPVPSRPVTVSITVRMESGEPLAAAPIQAIADEDHAFGFTNPQGSLELILDVRQDESFLVTRLSDGRWSSLNPAQADQAQERFQSLRTEHFFSRTKITPILASTTSCQIVMVAYPAITLTAQLGDGSDVVPFRRFHVRGGMSADDLDASEPFVVPGIRRDSPACVFVNVGLSPQFHVIHLDATQTSQDVDLGLVHMVDAPRTATAIVTMTNGQSLFDIDGSVLSKQAAFVRSDAQVILGFRVDQASGSVVERLTAAPPLIMPTLPPGTYYVCPGTLAMPLPLALFDAVRAGRQADLDAAGVPKFTAIEGQQVALQFDARAARDAIMACCPPQNP